MMDRHDGPDAQVPGPSPAMERERSSDGGSAVSARESGGAVGMSGNGDPAANTPGGGLGNPGGGAAEAVGRKGVVLGWWPLLAAIALVGSLLAFLEKLPCRNGAWNIPGKQFQLACYTDIYPLFFGERLADGKVPYTGHHVEYPVLIGAAMQAAASLVHPISDPFARGQHFFDVTVAGLAVCAVVGVLATAYLAGPARRPAVAGSLFGLAVAAKFYPLVFFGPLLLLCLRAGRMRAFWVTTGSAALAWLTVNLPVMLAAPSGWRTFYSFSRTRPADWGAIWYFFETRHFPFIGNTDVNTLNVLSLSAFAVCAVAIAVLALTAPRRPRLSQLFFLTLAAFLLTNKVWSPQYVVWLVPLAVLARPRLPAYVVWQLAEMAYFLAIWWYLLTVPGMGAASGFHGIGQGWYFTALLARFAATALLAGLVVRDILRPGADAVRADGTDDPAGGVLNAAADVFVLRRSSFRPSLLTARPDG